MSLPSPPAPVLYPAAGATQPDGSMRGLAWSREPLRRVVLGDGRPPGLQAGDRHAERAAGHVVQAHVVEEVHGVGVAAVLPADAGLEAGLGLATLLGRDLH